VLRFLTRERPSAGGLSRREWLRVGGLAGLGLGAATLRGTASPAARDFPGFGRAKSVILVYASGGQSQLDTWDPKPNAPEEIRGAFRPVATSVPGTAVCEHLPRLARLANRYTLLRSLSHDDLDHGSASYLALTGHFHARKSSNPLPTPADLPTYGAVVRRVRPAAGLPYSAVHLNGPALVPEIVAPGQFGGLLGRGYDPLVIGDPREAVALRGLDPAPELPPVRLEARRSLLQSLDGYRRDLGRDRAALERNALYRQAYDLLAAPESRRAFDLAREPRAVRERYGLNRPGQSCLLARRLVEAGVPFVTVIWSHCNRGQDKAPLDTEAYGWDTHNDIFEALQRHLLPHFDQGFSALLEDLDRRGLLATTLVVCVGEFGRAPRVALERTFAGSSPGRKHWAAVYSAVLAGAGVARGGLCGASDRHGAYPRTPPVGPWDVAATMFAALGIDPSGHYHDAQGRPYPVCTGKPIRGLYG
jgi:hypothetical protein